jgi:hypothetical protein
VQGLRREIDGGHPVEICRAGNAAHKEPHTPIVFDTADDPAHGTIAIEGRAAGLSAHHGFGGPRRIERMLPVALTTMPCGWTRISRTMRIAFWLTGSSFE